MHPQSRMMSLLAAGAAPRRSPLQFPFRSTHTVLLQCRYGYWPSVLVMGNRGIVEEGEEANHHHLELDGVARPPPHHARLGLRGGRRPHAHCQGKREVEGRGYFNSARHDAR